MFISERGERLQRVRWGRIFRTLFFAVLFPLVVIAPAWATPRLVGISLPTGAVIESQSITIRFQFSEPLARFGVGLARSGSPLAIDRPRKGDTPPEALIDFPPLPPGDYVLQWTAVGEDGGTVSGVQTFVVSGGTTTAPPPTPPAPTPVPTVTLEPTLQTAPPTTQPPTATTTTTTTTTPPTTPTTPTTQKPTPTTQLARPRTSRETREATSTSSATTAPSTTASPSSSSSTIPATPVALPVRSTSTLERTTTGPTSTIAVSSQTTPLSEPVPLTTLPGQTRVTIAPTRTSTTRTATTQPQPATTTKPGRTSKASDAPPTPTGTKSARTSAPDNSNSSVPGATLVIGQRPDELNIDSTGEGLDVGGSTTTESTAEPTSIQPTTTDPRAQEALVLPTRSLDQSGLRPVTVPVRTTPTTSTTTTTTTVIVTTQKPVTTQSRGEQLGKALSDRESGRSIASTGRLGIMLAAISGLLAMFFVTAARRSPRRLRNLIVGSGLVAAGVITALTILGLFDAARKVGLYHLLAMLLGGFALVGAALLRFAIGNRTLTRRDVAIHTRSNANVDPGGRVRRAMATYLRLASVQTLFALVSVLAAALLMTR